MGKAESENIDHTFTDMWQTEGPSYIIITEDTWVDNVLPKSHAGMWLKAGVYIDGVRQDD